MTTDNPYCPGLDYDRAEKALVAPVQKFLENRRLIEESQKPDSINEPVPAIVGNPEKVGVVP